MEVDSTVVKVAPEVVKTDWGDLVLNSGDAIVVLSKELFNGEGTITFTNESNEKTEVHGDWSHTLLSAYRQLVELRKAMNFYFFVDGKMKDDVSEISEGLRESVNFYEMFDLCESVGDKSMAYYCSYFMEVPLVTDWGKFKFPLCYLRNFNGEFYAELLKAMLDEDEDVDNRFEQDVPLVKVNKFDMDFYFAFCGLRTRLNGKMFMTEHKLLDIVKEFLDQYSYEVIGQAIQFGDYIGDAHGRTDDLMTIDFHQITEVCGCYFATLVGDEEDFDTVNDVVTRADKPATQLMRDSEEEATEDSGTAVKA